MLHRRLAARVAPVLVQLVIGFLNHVDVESDQARREKSRDDREHDLLAERHLHVSFYSDSRAALPKTPLARLHDVNAEHEVGERVNEHA